MSMIQNSSHKSNGEESRGIDKVDKKKRLANDGIKAYLRYAIEPIYLLFDLY